MSKTAPVPMQMNMPGFMTCCLYTRLNGLSTRSSGGGWHDLSQKGQPRRSARAGRARGSPRTLSILSTMSPVVTFNTFVDATARASVKKPLAACVEKVYTDSGSAQRGTRLV